MLFYGFKKIDIEKGIRLSLMERNSCEKSYNLRVQNIELGNFFFKLSFVDLKNYKKQVFLT